MRRRKTQIQTLDKTDADMTPMIDIVFLLLIFFLLTTTFVMPEKAIAQLLPTEQGTSAQSVPDIEKPDDIVISIVPAEMERGFQPSWYQQKWDTDVQRDLAWLRVGQSEPLLIDGGAMRFANIEQEQQHLGEIHQYIADQLQRRELGAAQRKDEASVLIHCYSGLPWRYALSVFDSVIAYEHDQAKTDGAALGTAIAQHNAGARTVDFAGPPIRHASIYPQGDELYYIVHKR